MSRSNKLGFTARITASHELYILEATDLIGTKQCCKSIWRKTLRAHGEGMRDLEQGRYAEGFCEVCPKTSESVVCKKDISLNLPRDVVHRTRVR
jgi:hypothetical protein